MANIIGQGCLIGSTGFVGSNLLRQRPFEERYHSKNIHEIRGRSFAQVVCCGVPGVKYLANRFPERDRASIDRLLENLRTIQTERLILISTIDVYGDTASGADEDYLPWDDPNHSYGRNRQHVERAVLELFPHTTIVRLPGVYGINLKKNLIYDLLNRHNTHLIDARNVFQWYSLARLWSDIELTLRMGWKIINLFPEPIQSAEIVEGLFASEYKLTSNGEIISLLETTRDSGTERPNIRYDLRTKYGSHFHGESEFPYIQDKADVMEDLTQFVTNSRLLKVSQACNR